MVELFAVFSAQWAIERPTKRAPHGLRSSSRLIAARLAAWRERSRLVRESCFEVAELRQFSRIAAANSGLAVGRNFFCLLMRLLYHISREMRKPPVC